MPLPLRKAGAKAAGCDAFLCKPFGLDALLAALRPYFRAAADG